MPFGPRASRDSRRGRYYDALQEEYSVVTEALHDAVYLDDVGCLSATAQLSPPLPRPPPRHPPQKVVNVFCWWIVDDESTLTMALYVQFEGREVLL